MPVEDIKERDEVKNPLVSIILPIYNTAEYLEESLDALLNQSLEELEIIAINDCSNDGSKEILDEYAKKDKRITVIDNEESFGPSICRNTGLEIIHGEYFTFYDSDDTIDLDAYEKLYAFAKEYDQDFIVSNAIRFNDAGREWPSILHNISIKGETYPKTNILEHKELVYDTTSWNKFIKRSFFEKHNFRFAEGRVYQDILFSMQMFCASDCIGIYPDVTYHWRVRQNKKKSITQSVSNTKNLKDRVFITTETIKVINSSPKHKELLEPLYAKLTEIDVLQFINELDVSDDEYKDIMFNEVRPFVKTFPPCVYDNISDIDKIRLNLFLNDCDESLIFFVGNERLRKEHDRKAKSTENKLKKDIKAKKENIKKLEDDLKKAKEDYEELNEDHNKLNKELTESQLYNKELESKNDKLKEEMKTVKSTKGWIKYKSNNIYTRALKK